MPTKIKIKCPKCGYEFEVGKHIITIKRTGLKVEMDEWVGD